MRIKSYLRIFLLLLQLYQVSLNLDCLLSITLRGCHNRFNITSEYSWRTFLRYRISLYVYEKKGCDYDTLPVQWEIKNTYLDILPIPATVTYYGKQYIIFEPHTLGVGLYIVKASIRLADNRELSAKCYVYYQSTKLKSHITGGTVRFHKGGTTLIVDGTQSVDLDRGVANPLRINYEWWCEPRFICPNNTDGILIIETHTRYMKMSFILRVWTLFGDDTSKEQIVYSDKITESWQINCQKNCWNFLGQDEIVLARAVCINCNYELQGDWDMFISRFDSSIIGKVIPTRIPLVYGDKDVLALTNKYDLVEGPEVDLYYNFADRVFTASYSLLYRPWPYTWPLFIPFFGPNVDMSNYGGEVYVHQPFITSYNIYYNDTVYYRVYDNKVLILVTTMHPLYKQIDVSPGPGNVDVRYGTRNNFRNSTINKQNLIYTYATDYPKGDVEEYRITQELGPLCQFYRAKSILDISERVNSLIGIIKYLKGDHTLFAQRQFLRISELVYKSEWDVTSIISLFDAIMQNEVLTMDFLIGNKTNFKRFCFNIASSQFENMLTSNDRYSYTEEIHENWSILLYYAIKVIPTKEAKIPARKYTQNLTTPYPLIDILVPCVEDTDYEDMNDEYWIKFNHYRENTFDEIKLRNLFGIGLGMTMAGGEQVRTVQVNESTDFAVIADDATHFRLNRQEMGQNFTIMDSATLFLRKITVPQVVRVITVFDNNFFWEPDINLTIGKTLAVHFFNRRTFKRVKPPILQQFRYMGTLEQSHNTTVQAKEYHFAADKEKYGVKNLAMYKISVSDGEIVQIKYLNKYNISIIYKENSLITREDIRESSFILVRNELYTIPLCYTYGDTWLYLIFIPTGLPVGGMLSKEIDIVLSILSCRYWQQLSNSWGKKGCTIKSNENYTTESDYMECSCYVGEIFTIRLSKKQIERINYFPIRFIIDWQFNYIVLFAILIPLLIYLIMTVAYLPTRYTMARFLMDNCQSGRYCYLIMVRTGPQIGADTTSNIGIRIYGATGSSKAHILNYPDPQKSLLNKAATDSFFLTSDYHLGEIEAICLWHDSVGVKPDWYCSTVDVQDLQTLTEYKFNVHSWFSVLKSNERFKYIWASADVDRKWKLNFLYNLKEGLGYYVNQEEQILLLFTIVNVIYSVVLVLLKDNFERDTLSNFQTSFMNSYTDYALIAVTASVISYTFASICRLCINYFHNKRLVRFGVFFVAIAINISCIIHTITFGLWFHYCDAMIWLAISLAAMLINMFLIHFIIVLLISYMQKYCFKVRNEININKLLYEIERQRLALHRHYGACLLRSYFISKYEALSREEWNIKRYYYLQRLEIVRKLPEFIHMLIFLIILIVMISFHTNDHGYASYENMRATLMGNHTHTMPFTDINRTDDVYKYINATVVPFSQPVVWYPHWAMRDPGLMIDYSTRIIGIIRLRQQRVCSGCCTIPNRTLDLLQKANISGVVCLPEFEAKYHVRDAFTFQWGQLVSGIEYYDYNLTLRHYQNVWLFMHNFEHTGFRGVFAYYPDGGFMAPLGRSEYNTWYNVKQYAISNWLDHQTRLICMEFLAYNPNSNLFSFVRLIIERGASEMMNIMPKIWTTQLFYYHPTLDALMFITAIFFVLTLSILVYEKIMRSVTRLGKSRWWSMWNIFHIGHMCTVFACFLLYIYRMIVSNRFLAQLKLNTNFTEYSQLIRVEAMLKGCVTILLCITIYKLFFAMRLTASFKKMVLTLRHAKHSLIAIISAHLVIICSFSMAATISFGRHCYCYSDFWQSLITVIVLAKGMDDHCAFNDHFVFLLLYATVTVFFMAFYVVTLVKAVRWCRERLSNYRQKATVKGLVNDEVNHRKNKLIETIHQRSRGGGAYAYVEKVFAKTDEHRYAGVCAMDEYRFGHTAYAICQCVAITADPYRDRMHFTQAKANTMRKTIYYLTNTEHRPHDTYKFYRFYNDNERVQFLADSRLQRMEKIVRYIIDECTKENLKRHAIDPDSETAYAPDIGPRFQKIAQRLRKTARAVDKIDFYAYQPPAASGEQAKSASKGRRKLEPLDLAKVERHKRKQAEEQMREKQLKRNVREMKEYVKQVKQKK